MNSHDDGGVTLHREGVLQPGELEAILERHQAWLRSEPGGQRANLGGANLRGKDLRRANLRRADLRWASLRWADLRWADLGGADMYGADLRWADLRWADFSWADLRWADLRRANLRGADLSEASLEDAGLRGAELGEATNESECDSRTLYATLREEVEAITAKLDRHTHGWLHNEFGVQRQGGLGFFRQVCHRVADLRGALARRAAPNEPGVEAALREAVEFARFHVREAISTVENGRGDPFYKLNLILGHMTEVLAAHPAPSEPEEK